MDESVNVASSALVRSPLSADERRPLMTSRQSPHPGYTRRLGDLPQHIQICRSPSDGQSLDYGDSRARRRCGPGAVVVVLPGRRRVAMPAGTGPEGLRCGDWWRGLVCFRGEDRLCLGMQMGSSRAVAGDYGHGTKPADLRVTAFRPVLQRFVVHIVGGGCFRRVAATTGRPSGLPSQIACSSWETMTPHAARFGEPYAPRWRLPTPPRPKDGAGRPDLPVVVCGNKYSAGTSDVVQYERAGRTGVDRRLGFRRRAG